LPCRARDREGSRINRDRDLEMLKGDTMKKFLFGGHLEKYPLMV